MEKNFWKNPVLLELMAFERVVGTYVDYDENIGERQARC